MILEICASLLVILCLVVIVYLIFFSKPVKITKRVSGSVVHITVKANRDIEQIDVTAGKDIGFIRKHVKKGQEVEFTYPTEESPAKLVIQLGKDKSKTYEL